MPPALVNKTTSDIVIVPAQEAFLVDTRDPSNPLNGWIEAKVFPISPIPPAVIAELAPTGVLRAGINVANFLLVSSVDDDGTPRGVAPDLATHIASQLGVPVRLVPFATPSELANAAGQGVWDIALVGAEPQRAETITFSPAYVELDATFLVPEESAARRPSDVDCEGVRIAVTRGAAYTLWLERNFTRASLVYADTLPGAAELFAKERLDALAGLRSRLVEDVVAIAGTRILDGRFTAVQQAVGTAKANAAGAAFLRDVVEQAKASGLIARLIEAHGVSGLSVAGSA